MVPKVRGKGEGRCRHDLLPLSATLSAIGNVAFHLAPPPLSSAPLLISLPTTIPFISGKRLLKSQNNPTPTPLFVPAVILPLLPFTTQSAFLLWLMVLNSSFVTSHIRIQINGHGLWGRRLNHMFAGLASVKGYQGKARASSISEKVMT